MVSGKVNHGILSLTKPAILLALINAALKILLWHECGMWAALKVELHQQNSDSLLKIDRGDHTLVGKAFNFSHVSLKVCIASLRAQKTLESQCQKSQ